jgi:hypothetical protein
MTRDEAIVALLDALELTTAKAGARYVAECQEIFESAIAPGEPLPTSWADVLARVKLLQRQPRQMEPGKGLDLIKVITPVTYAVDTGTVPFPKLD